MSLTIRPFAHLKELDSIGRGDKTNVAYSERVGSLALGSALLLYGVSRRSLSGALLSLLGGAFIYRGSTGQCELYRKLGVNTAFPSGERGVPGNKGIKVERTTHVDRPPTQVFHYWRKLENLPRFMPHLSSVEEKTDRLSHWVANGPAGSRLEWDAEIINEHPGSMISWQSLPGSLVESAGSVWFEREGSGTRVKVSLLYQPVGGAVGTAVAKILGDTPHHQIAEDLARFKAYVEGDSDTRSN